MKLTLVDLFKIEHDLLFENDDSYEIMSAIVEFVNRILIKEEEVKNNG